MQAVPGEDREVDLRGRIQAVPGEDRGADLRGRIQVVPGEDQGADLHEAIYRPSLERTREQTYTRLYTGRPYARPERAQLARDCREEASAQGTGTIVR